MKGLITKYLNKLHQQGLANREKAIFIAIDAELFLNRPLSGNVFELSRLFNLMNINTILYSEPSEPYKSIVYELTELNSHFNQIVSSGVYKFQAGYLNQHGIKRIIPMDCESKTFLHDIPIINNFNIDEIVKALSLRKSAIIKNHGIISYGTLTPEQAYVSYASTCFALFVKYFTDTLVYLEYCFQNHLQPDKLYLANFKKILESLKQTGIICKYNENYSNDASLSHEVKSLIKTKPQNDQDVIKMLCQTGKAVVQHRLVDSYFGNISYVFEDKIYISQTGSSLDELEGCIDAVPLDGSSTVGITASSELSTHKNIYFQRGDNAILHAHPLFSVIMSLYCSLSDCQHYVNRDKCHKGCKKDRYIEDIPVVSGEIGTGKTGIVNTVPFKMKKSGSVIVYGHGVFTCGKDNFIEPLSKMLSIERLCQREYFKKVRGYIKNFRY